MKHRCPFIFLTILVGVCIYLFFDFYSSAKKTQINNLNARQMIHAEQAARGIEEFFHQWITLLARMSKEDSIIHLDDSGKRKMNALYNANEDTVDVISRVDAQGRILYAVPYNRAVIGKDISHLRHVREVIKTHKPVVSDVFRNIRGFDSVTIHVPVFRQNLYNGSLAVLINFKAIARRYLEPIRIGTTGYAWMISKDGIVLQGPKLQHAGKSIFEIGKDYPSIISMARKMIRGDEGATTYVYYAIHGKSVKPATKHAVYMPIKIGTTLWSIAVATSEDEALATLVGFRNRLLVLIGIFFVGIVLFSYFGMKAWGIIQQEKKRKKAEDELHHSEQRYMELYDNLRDGIVVTDNNGTIIDCNKQFLNMLGYTMKEIKGMSCKDITPVKWHDIEAYIIREQVDTRGYSSIYEKEYKRKDGTVFPIEIQTYVTRSSGGDPVGYWALTRDITDRKLAEQITRENREKLQAIAEGSSIPQFAIDKDHKVILWNKALEIYSGIKATDILGTKNHWKAFYKEPRPCLVDLVIESAPQKEIAQWYGTMFRKSRLIQDAYEATQYFPSMQGGTWLYFTTVTIRDNDGNITACIETLEDISELKMVESSLRKSEQDYRSIFENAVEGIYRTTREGRFLVTNPAFVRMAGYDSPEELISTITDVARQMYVRPHERETFIGLIEKNSYVENYEHQLYRKDGTPFWVSVNSRVVKDATGATLYYEGTIEDITRRKEAEENLQDTLERLRNAIGTSIQAMIAAVETKDPYTAGHQKRTTDLARAIGREMELSQDTIEAIRMAGSIHDIGKISVPAEILSKPTKLTDLEFSLVKAHAQNGYEILKDVESPWPLAQIVAQHHERINGSGYPFGLKGGEILIEARIIAVADVVEAIASHRPYRPGLGIDTALAEIEKNRGILYDPGVVDVCLKLFREKGFNFE